MTDLGTAPGKQLRLPLAPLEGEAGGGERRRDAPVCLPRLLERALERSNMQRALRRVRRNAGRKGATHFVDAPEPPAPARRRRRLSSSILGCDGVPARECQPLPAADSEAVNRALREHLAAHSGGAS